VAIALDVWTKVASWYDGTTMRLYVNDVLVGEATVAYTHDWNLNYLQTEIGNNTWDIPAGCWQFSGAIDDVMVSTTRP